MSSAHMDNSYTPLKQCCAQTKLRYVDDCSMMKLARLGQKKAEKELESKENEIGRQNEIIGELNKKLKRLNDEWKDTDENHSQAQLII